MQIQSFSTSHVDALILIEGLDLVRFSGFYGFRKLNQRQLSWDMLKNIGKNVREDWIVGGDLNEIIDENEKCGGRGKYKVAMHEFKGVVNELALVDVKPDKGWLTCTNNRRGEGLVKERLDCYLVFASWLRKVPFLSSTLLRQANFDHDVIILDTMGRRPRDGRVDSRVLFRFEECWAQYTDVKMVIKGA